MKSILFLLAFLFLYSASFSQKEYRKFRESLPGLTCGVDTLRIETHLSTINQLNAHVKDHPEHYGAYYDLGMEYYTVAAKEDSKTSVYWQKSIDAFEQFITMVKGKYKSGGYQNLAVIHGYLGNCDKAISNIEQWDQVTPKKYRSCGTSTESWIRKKCEEKEG